MARRALGPRRKGRNNEGAILARMEGRIIIDAAVCGGQPVVRGTRITARTILEFLAAGDTLEDVLEEFPSLTREDVLACLAFGARAASHRFTVQSVAS